MMSEEIPTNDTSAGSVNGARPPLRAVNDGEDLRPQILVSSELQANVDASISALATEKHVFKRAGMLVHLVPSDERTAYGWTKIPKIRPLPVPVLRATMSKVAVYMAKNKKGEWYSTLPPEPIVKAVHSEGRWRSVRRISGISSIPLLRTDGTVMQTIGHDEESGYYYLPLEKRPIEVPANPTKADAEGALSAILDVVCDFPFLTPADRSVWLGALLTVAGRSAIHGVTPLFAFDASTRGSGKTRLAHMISTIVSGNEVAIMAPPSTEEEFGKKVTSILLRGEPMVVIDNVTRRFGGGCIDALTTSLRWTDRILGQSTMATLENMSVWFVTGNNVHLMGDLARRTLICRLQPDDERPEDRDNFKHQNILRHVHDRRHILASQALTVLRAWYVAGCPGAKSHKWGSFEAWAEIIPAVLTWLGQANPLDRRASFEDDQDEDKLALDAVCAWMRPLGALTIAEIVKRVEITGDGPNTLRETARGWLELLAGEKGQRGINAKSLPYVLRRWKGRVADGGYRLGGTQDTHTKTVRWEFAPISGGFAGDPNTPSPQENIQW